MQTKAGVSSHAITIKRAMKSESLSSTLLVRRGLSGKFHTICYIGWPISKNDSVVKKSWLKSIWYKKWWLSWYAYTKEMSRGVSKLNMLTRYKFWIWPSTYWNIIWHGFLIFWYDWLIQLQKNCSFYQQHWGEVESLMIRNRCCILLIKSRSGCVWKF